MRVTLLIPPTSLEKNSYGRLQRFSFPQPSIGLGYIAAVLEKNGYDVRILDAYAVPSSLEEILSQLDGTDLLGISLLTPSANAAYRLCREIRSKYPRMVIVHGNMHAALFPGEVFSRNYGDYVVHREGELTLLELCDFISGRKNIRKEDIKGISYLENGKIRTTDPRPFISDLDALPFPAWHLYDFANYPNDPRSEVVKGERELQILATRGCPMECTFCSSRSDRSQGQAYRMRAPGKIVEEIKYFHEKYGVTVFHFMDLSFPLAKNHAVEFCRLMIDSGLSKKVKWVSELRVKPLDHETVSMIKKSGCVRVYFGIESGNDDVLKMIKKGFTRCDVSKAVDLCRAEGLEIDGMFILGLPGENKRTMEDTVRFAMGLDVRFAIFNLFVPYPGCQLYDELTALGKVRFDDWSDFISYPTYSDKEPVYVPDGLSKAELMKTQASAMRRFYFRPKFIRAQIKSFRFLYVPHYISGIKGILLAKAGPAGAR